MTGNVVINLFLLFVLLFAIFLMLANYGTSNAGLSYVMGVAIIALVAVTILAIRYEDSNDLMLRALHSAKDLQVKGGQK